MNEVGTMMTRLQRVSTTHSRDINPTDEMKRSVSEVLKTADSLIRRGHFDEAEVCVTKAQQLDPQNIYAFAFKERIAILRQEALGKSSEGQTAIGNPGGTVKENIFAVTVHSQEVPVNPHQPPPKSMYPISKEQLLAAAKDFLEPEFRSTEELMSEKSTLAETKDSSFSSLSARAMSSCSDSISDLRREMEESRDAKIQRLVKNAMETARKQVGTQSTHGYGESQTMHLNFKDIVESAQQLDDRQRIEYREALEGDLQERIREALRRRTTSVELPDDPFQEREAGDAISQSREPSCDRADHILDTERSETLARYQLVLASVWADGAASEEEVETLEQLRQLLSITLEEHDRIQKEVQLDMYIEAFKRAWNAGRISKKDIAVLAELRERFHISMEEHLAIESRILWETQPEKDRPTLLVVDDDEMLLSVVTNTLNNAGFFTAPFTTSDEALSYLRESTPDLILCDVNLRTSSMGGFAFYEKVRELDQLRNTPFIFLSGLTDETLVSAGKELGVDDYLSKPVSEETLLATIRGKLRRYNELKERSN